MSRLRILRNAQGQVDHTFLVGTTPTDPDGNVATVDITRGDGSAFLTDQATSRISAGVYRYALAPQADLDIFTLEFKGTFGGTPQKSTPTLVEVVGSYFVSLVDIRALDGLTNAGEFPNAKLEEARSWFEDLAERHCGVAFVPRYGRDVLDGDGTEELLLSRLRIRRLLSVKIDGTVEAVSSFRSWPIGKIGRVGGSFPTTEPRNVEVTYEHGSDAPEDDLRDAALQAIRSHLLVAKSGIPERALTLNVGERGLPFEVKETTPTGIPSVDAVLADYRVRVPGIA